MSNYRRAYVSGETYFLPYYVKKGFYSAYWSCKRVGKRADRKSLK